MGYIVNQDIIDRVGSAAALQLTTDSGSSPSTTVLDEVRLSSEGEVNGYLATRYAVPVDLTAHADVAATLKAFTLDIAVYRLHLRRSLVSDADRNARNDAVKWLEGVAKGAVDLPAATTPASSTSDQPTAEWGSKEQNAATLRDL